MTLLLAHSHHLSYPRYYNSSRSSISSSQPAISLKLVQCHPRVFRCCAVNGGFEDSRDDGGFVAASDTPPRVTNNSEAASTQNHAAQVPAIANSSDAAASDVGEASAAAWIPATESRIERVWLM